jgi:hypothetical protein
MTPIERVELGVLILGGVCVAAVIGLSFRPVQPSKPVTAKVISMSPVGAKFPRVLIVARTSIGITSEMIVPWDDFRCHVGDDVSGTQTGISVVLDRSSCRSADQTSSTRRP